jgi:peroxiredoxin/nitrate/TMAO reductase-like tetraheme cytochrome c subunit
VSGCEQQSSGSPSAARAVSAEPEGGGEKAASRPVQRAERPLPAFSGPTLAGGRFSVSSVLGKRTVIFFFNPEVHDSDVVADALAAIAPQRGPQNFGIVGVATGSNAPTARAFVERHGIDYPVVDDSSARITRQLGLRAPTVVLGIDSEGYVVFGFGQFSTSAPDPVAHVASQLREALRLPDPNGPEDVVTHPPAPDFTATPLEGDKPISLASLRGHGVVLIFFLHTCPHCHDALLFLKEQLAALPESMRPRLLGIELSGKRQSVRERLRKDGLDFFPVLFDDDGSITNKYGVFGGVPDIFLIDAKGRIVAHSTGWLPEYDGPLMRMRLAKLGGAPIPMLLRQDGYSGSQVCSVCHEQQEQTWRLTAHATAFDTLVRHGADTNPDCVGCHVVGFGKKGGFEISPHTVWLEDVGCESCHGRGGPHLSPDFVRGGDYAPACLGCHDQKHSLDFDYAAFLPRISHAANAHILALPAEERNRILAERGAAQRELLPMRGDYVGSNACKSCHPAEFATWAAGPHASAGKTLTAEKRGGDAACLACHTTAIGRTGGFPLRGKLADHADLGRVGCESCHGPGGEHVKPESTKRGSIVSLGDKCDSCVILQICGTCHDEANDPGFEFKVTEKIDKIRHGTTSPDKAAASGIESSDAAAHAASPLAVAHGVDHAFALLSATTERGPVAR